MAGLLVRPFFIVVAVRVVFIVVADGRLFNRREPLKNNIDDGRAHLVSCAADVVKA